MWKCIRCEKENQDSAENCVNCEHGRTMDYTGHRVLSKIRPEITDTWKYTQINPDILKIQAGRYLLKAESLLKISGEDSLAKKIREMMIEIAAEAIVNRYEGADLSNVNEKPMLMPDNISVYLSADSTAPSVLGSKFLRKDVCEIDFVKMSLDDIPSGAWDVSADKNGKIWAWMDETPDGYILNIGSENGVYANTNCNAFFCYYWDVKKIEFNNLFDTSYVTDMSWMFFSCGRLTELDVSKFETGSVESMANMFDGCWKLTELDVSGFRTDKVRNFAYMFRDCDELERLDVNRFETGCAENMSGMFRDCLRLTELDVSGFKTNKVRKMDQMFMGCNKMESLDVSKFETGSVENMSMMFFACESLTELDVRGFDTKNVTDMTEMFVGCDNLQNLDISNFYFREDVKRERMFGHNYFKF